MAKIFVYGTLRSKATNAHRMGNASLLGDAKVRGKLYRIDWYPGLKLPETTYQEVEESWVLGEIYEADRGLLEELDAYEGAEYRRVVTIATLADASEGSQRSVEALVYEYIDPVSESQHILSGDWLSQ